MVNLILQLISYSFIKILNMKNVYISFLVAITFASCVSSKKLKQEQARYSELNTSYQAVQKEFSDCRSQQEENARKRAQLENTIDNLNKEIGFLKENTNNMIGQLKNLSVISSTQAQSIAKSLENISSKDAYITALQQSMARKDSLNMALVLNLKSALKDVNDQDIDVKVEKGVVFINISDKLLFKTASYTVSNRALEVLEKVATVLNSHPEIEFLVEGHTDNVPIQNSCIEDNWDLSVKRATSVVRILQTKFNIDPKRMTAGGRSQYVPLNDNATPEDKAANRRTRIVILPQLDQFFKLLEKTNA